MRHRGRVLFVMTIIFFAPVAFVWLRYPDSPHTTEATIAAVVGIIFLAGWLFLLGGKK